jgi:hypothetical protein
MENRIMARTSEKKSRVLTVELSGWGAMFCFIVFMPGARGAKSQSKTLTTTNGSPVRRVYVQSATLEMASSATVQLTQDTCLTVVSDLKQADAVLDVGIALPGVGGGTLASDGNGHSRHAQTMGNAKSKPQRSFTATCSDGKSSGSCTPSTSGFGSGGLEQPSDFAGTGNATLDVSLTEAGNNSQELWEPTPDKKKSWTEQLRQAAGCPVCTGEHFNRHKYPTYRSWIQAECPAVLSAH